MAATGAQSSSSQGSGSIVVKDPPKLDLESYISNYTGRTKFERLAFIGAHSVPLQVEALKAAVIEAKRGRDVERYRSVQANLADVSSQEPEAIYDEKWVANMLKQNKAEIDRIQAELKEYKNNLVKESIRMGHEDAGNFHFKTGDLPKAFDDFSRMRADVSMNKHIIDVSRHLVDVCLERRDWMLVFSNVQKITVAQKTPDEEKAINPYIKVAAGIAQLSCGKFNEAAQSFLSVGSGVGDSLNTVISPNDIAVYGGLCALASMDREQLQKQVLENTFFRTYLELEPHIRRAVSLFVNGRYSACLTILEGYRNDYLLDIHLQAQVSEIYFLIRSKSIVQYFIPFSCVTLDSLNDAFAVHDNSLEDELTNMITRGTLEARLDTQNRTLVHVPKVPRAALQKHTIQSAKAYEREMRKRLIRMNITGAGLEVTASRKNQLGGDDVGETLGGWSNRP